MFASTTGAHRGTCNSHTQCSLSLLATINDHHCANSSVLFLPQPQLSLIKIACGAIQVRDKLLKCVIRACARPHIVNCIMSVGIAVNLLKCSESCQHQTGDLVTIHLALAAAHQDRITCQVQVNANSSRVKICWHLSREPLVLCRTHRRHGTVHRLMIFDYCDCVE